MKKPVGMTEESFRLMVKEGKKYRKRIKRGIKYFGAGMPLAEIVDDVEQRGWKCGEARKIGRKAKKLSDNPYAKEAALTYELAVLNAFFLEGFKQTHK